MITLSNADAALKDYYLDAVTAQLNGEVSPFFNAISKTSENVFGKDVKLAIAKGNLAGIVATGEDADLPAPHVNRYYSVTMPLKNIYGTIEISDKAMRASGNASGAFVNLLNAEMEGLVDGAKSSLARMLYGDGNGYLCTVTSKTGATILHVDDAKSFFAGLTVKIAATNPITATISAVDTDNKTLYITGVSLEGVGSGTKIYLANAENNELTGLKAIFDENTVYGYNKAANPYFAPRVAHVNTSALTESDLIEMIDSLEERAGGKVNMILCSYKVRKQIAALMSSSRRIVNSADISAGYSSIVVNDVPVYADKFCTDGRIYFLNTDDFTLNQLCDWSWIEDEGGKILKQVNGKAAYSATLVKYAELICKKPCGQGVILLES